ncbi:hypothetical protein KJ980_06570, partial [Patescibacteria group bacterium]|nr:hypothetical protein [Patescibacteria group bacterium]
SEGEKALLLSADVGEGLFFAGQNHVAIKAFAAPFEHELITSNPMEILKRQEARKAISITHEPITKPTTTNPVPASSFHSAQNPTTSTPPSTPTGVPSNPPQPSPFTPPATNTPTAPTSPLSSSSPLPPKQ